MATQTEAAVSTFPFLSILALIFITLKLLGEITWSWWWVLAPIWIPIVLFFGTLLVIGVVALIGLLVSEGLKKRRSKRAHKARLDKTR